MPPSAVPSPAVTGAEAIRKSAFGTLKFFQKYLSQSPIFLNAPLLEDIVSRALRRHREHLAAHQVNQRSLEPFKLACWLCGEFLEEVRISGGAEAQRHGVDIIFATVKVLNRVLMLETNARACADQPTFDLIKNLVFEEYFGNARHGVGMNGLFLVFHGLRKGARCVLDDELTPFTRSLNAAKA